MLVLNNILFLGLHGQQSAIITGEDFRVDLDIVKGSIYDFDSLLDSSLPNHAIVSELLQMPTSTTNCKPNINVSQME